MKKNITAFIIIICMLFFTGSINVYRSIYNFNHTSVKNNIEYISSNNFMGRLAGTVENMAAGAFIKNQFKAIGLLPFDGDYYDPFDSNYPHRLNDQPYLKIQDKNGALVKEYKYGIDYKEEMLNFSKNYVEFTKRDFINDSDGSIQVTKGNDSFLFFSPQEDILSFRSSFMNSDPRALSMYIMTTKNTIAELKIYISKNYKISCYIPFEVTKTKLNNVVGCIKGKDTTAPPLIVSAHFDHLGSDLSGNVYSGALDNASGISFVLEFAKYIKSLGTPDRNIIFIGFNAEEFGCLGSEHFVNKFSSILKGSKVYNFDMIGSNSVPLSIMGGKDDDSKTNFMRSISSTLNTERIKYNFLFEDASDHEAFRKYNIDAVTFCDSDTSKIHTPNDKAEFISTEAIDRCFNAASVEIIKNAFDGDPILMHYKKTLLFSAFGFILFSIIYRIQVTKY